MGFVLSNTPNIVLITIPHFIFKINVPEKQNVHNIKNVFEAHGSVHHNLILIKIQADAIVGSLIYFTAKSLHMFRMLTAPIIRAVDTRNM